MRVAIVNDLRIAQETLKRVLASEPGWTLAWTAWDGAEAVAQCRADRPDLVLMDLVMPTLDGVEATRRIMIESPCPILIVTATVDGYASKVFQALGAGALDAVKCPTLGPEGTLVGVDRLRRKMRALRVLAPPGTLPPPPRSPALPAAPEPSPEAPLAASRDMPLVALGASTGGPQALVEVLRGFSSSFTPPVLVVQHINAEFAEGLVAWLAAETRRRVAPARPGDRPREGEVLVAVTDDHLVAGAGGTLRYEVEPAESLHRPSVDVLFESLARHGGAPGVAAVLTGMGRDGAQGLLRLREAGWATLAQDEASSVVWGMPRACHECGAAQALVPLEAMGARIETLWRRAAHLPAGEVR